MTDLIATLEGLKKQKQGNGYQFDKPRPVYIGEGIYWTPTPRVMRWLNRTAALRLLKAKEAEDGR